MSIRTQQVFLMTALVFGSHAAQAQVNLTEAEQSVVDHYKNMQSMGSEERKTYREQLFSGMSRSEQKSFQEAFKSIRSRLPELLGIEDTATETNKNQASANSGQSVRVPGSGIQYDSGNTTGTAGVASQMVGNRFDTAINTMGTACCSPVETSGTITMATFEMVNTFFGSAVFSVYSNVVGTGAVQVTSMAYPGLMTGLNTITLGGGGTANAYANGSFLAGIWQFDPTMTAIGVDTGTTGGQGHHGISLNDGAMGTMLTNLTSLNAVMRLQGNLVTASVPVELIDFTIEEDQDQ